MGSRQWALRALCVHAVREPQPGSRGGGVPLAANPRLAGTWNTRSTTWRMSGSAALTDATSLLRPSRRSCSSGTTGGLSLVRLGVSADTVLAADPRRDGVWRRRQPNATGVLMAVLTALALARSRSDERSAAAAAADAVAKAVTDCCMMQRQGSSQCVPGSDRNTPTRCCAQWELSVVRSGIVERFSVYEN